MVDFLRDFRIRDQIKQQAQANDGGGEFADPRGFVQNERFLNLREKVSDIIARHREACGATGEERRSPEFADVRAIFDAMPEDRRLQGVMDSLTKLPNRNAFEWHEEQYPGWHTVVFDLLGFKNIRDAHGHDFGDEALHAVAKAMQREAGSPSEVFVARWGGDENAAVVLTMGYTSLIIDLNHGVTYVQWLVIGRVFIIANPGG